MSTTSEKAAYTLETKQEIARALIDQGQTVNEYDTFRSYADKIRAIKSRDHAATADKATEADHAATADTLSGVLPVEKGGTGATTPEALALALGACRCVTGTVKGTGANQITLTLGFVPRIIMITGDYRIKDRYDKYCTNVNGWVIHYLGNRAITNVSYNGTETHPVYHTQETAVTRGASAEDGYLKLSSFEPTDDGCVVSFSAYNLYGVTVGGSTPQIHTDANTTFEYVAIG